MRRFRTFTGAAPLKLTNQHVLVPGNIPVMPNLATIRGTRRRDWFRFGWLDVETGEGMPVIPLTEPFWAKGGGYAEGLPARKRRKPL